VQARIRTAINESDVAARTTSIEQALAKLSERLDTEIASRRDIADLRRLVAEDARRLDALRREVADVGEAANAAVVQRLDAVQQGVAAIPDAMRAGTARRAPIPLGGEVMAWTPDGYLLLPAEDLRLLAAMSEGGVLEHGTRLVLAALLEPGGAFLDVGAHVGTMALLGARRVGEHGRVFAVEPLPRLAALLRRSMALNDLADRVSVAACAAGEADAEGLLHLGEVLGHSSLLPLSSAPNAEAVRVPVRRIDDVVPAGTRIDVAKIDAEGCELQVWRGMRRVLEESPRLAAVLECGPSHLARAGTTPEAWLGELEAAGFASYTIDEATGACRPASAPALAGVFSTNVLLLRPGAAARHPGLVFA
jgi:FkbM family methyltransferase